MTFGRKMAELGQIFCRDYLNLIKLGEKFVAIFRVAQWSVAQPRWYVRWIALGPYTWRPCMT